MTSSIPSTAPRHRRAPLAALLCALLLLAGCSLDFVDSEPPDAGTLLAGNAPIEVRFDRPLDPTQVSATGFSLTQGDERIPAKVTLTGSGDGLRFEPLARLRPGPATLTIEPGVRALGSRRSRKPVALTFEVKPSAVPGTTMRSSRFQLQGGVGGAVR